MIFSMTKEDRNLLLRDISGRLNYGLKVCYVTLPDNMPKVWDLIGLPAPHLADIQVEGRYRFAACDIEENIRPYLRSMSSMTEEEKYEYRHLLGAQLNSEGESILFVYIEDLDVVVDWLNKNHFDYRGLIENGLAIEAPEEMYN